MLPAKKIPGKLGSPLMSREYIFSGKQPGFFNDKINKELKKTSADGVVIQDHSHGHKFNDGGIGDQGPHFNSRPNIPQGDSPNNTNFDKSIGIYQHYGW